MNAAMALVCRVSSTQESPVLQWMPTTPRDLAPDEVRVRVNVASVNPIDVKRAAGYGNRALSLFGAGGSELVLGNDFVGTVLELGHKVTDVRVGETVWGLVKTGNQGSHRSEVCVSSRWIRHLPPNIPAETAAALPYTFTTVWRALQAIGVDQKNAAGRRALISGAGGALGQLSIQLLSRWGCKVTAICSNASADRCIKLGASQAIDRHFVQYAKLPSDYDISLNFGSWVDEADLIGRLHSSAFGHATTVHPLLGAIDAHGWLRGGLACAREWLNMCRRVRAISPMARCAWVMFRPDESALDLIQTSFLSEPLSLEVACRVPFQQANAAFSHVGQGQATRAVLTSSGCAANGEDA